MPVQEALEACGGRDALLQLTGWLNDCRHGRIANRFSRAEYLESVRSWLRYARSAGCSLLCRLTGWVHPGSPGVPWPREGPMPRPLPGDQRRPPGSGLPAEACLLSGGRLFTPEIGLLVYSSVPVLK